MAKRSGKKKALFFFSRRSRSPLTPPRTPAEPNQSGSAAAADTGGSGKGAKKKNGLRLWMRFDREGQSEALECDKSAVIRRASVPARDLRILGPVFSHTSNILAREKAMVVNLEFVKALVTAEEVLILDPLCQEVIPFVDQLRRQIPIKGGEGDETELPFEFQVLEIALEAVCVHFDARVADLERDAYPVLDELTRNVSKRNLERVRSLKSNLTRLLARVQKVRDEIEHLLDDDEDMANLHLTRRQQIQAQQVEALMSSATSTAIVPSPNLTRVTSNVQGIAGTRTSISSHDNDVENLEMLLEAYFMQLDGARNKILSVREYIDDTEDYVNIQLDHQRNELIQLQLVLSIASFAIGIDTFIVGAFAMNIHWPLYDVHHIFWSFVAGTSGGCFIIFWLLLWYARWKKLLGS